MSINVFKTRIDNYTKEKINLFIDDFLEGEKTGQIVTINPEFLLEAQKNEKFRNAINNSDLSVPDGSGLNIAFWKNKKKMKYRYPGVDLTTDILKKLNKREMSVFLVVNKNGLTSFEKIKRALHEKFPKIKIKGLNCESIENLSESLIKKVSGSDVVLCNFGAPIQELFLFNLKNANIENIKLVIGVGGTFDFLAGSLQRAPKFMRKMGLEWLYRVFLQPWRFRRIINAVIVFPIKVLISKE